MQKNYLIDESNELRRFFELALRGRPRFSIVGFRFVLYDGVDWKFRNLKFPYWKELNVNWVYNSSEEAAY